MRGVLAAGCLRQGWSPFVIIPMTFGAGVAWVGIRLLS